MLFFMAARRVALALMLSASQATAGASCSAGDSIDIEAGSASLILLQVGMSSAGADDSLQEHDVESLLQVDVSKHRRSRSQLRAPYDAGWFGSFSEGESTFDHDGTLAHRGTFPSADVMDGWNPQQQNHWSQDSGWLLNRAVEPAWFQETKSGGQKEVWQTFYPAEDSSTAGNRVETGPWFRGDGGNWQQEYLSSEPMGVEGPSASWFDSSVKQLDGFGRQKVPGFQMPRNYLDWEERSVNTSLACAAAGCTANVSLVAPFDFNKEMYKNCRLSVFFHPTDFDNQYSGESVEWVQVNGRKVDTFCHPHAMGCNESASRPLLPCVHEVPIDLLLDHTAKNGDLKIAAKIHDYVDECPYKGNMLSAVPMVTCLVAPKHIEDVKPVTLLDEMTCETKMPLKCATKGCASEIAIPVNSTCAGLGQCLLSVEVQQTDYDNGDGTTELIEYIKVDGKNVKEKMNPGKNPCKAKWSGKALTDQEMSFVALQDHALNVTNGKVVVEGKITKFVDECPSHGHLFYAMATVKCSKPGAKAATKLIQEKNGLAQQRELKVKRSSK